MRRRWIIPLGLALFLSTAPAQAGDEFRERIIGRIYTGAEIRKNLEYLCDRIGGRLSGTESGRKAEEYAKKVFTEYGLQNVRFETFTMLGWERGELDCEVSSPIRRTLGAIALGNTPSTSPEGVFASVIDVGFGSPGEFEAKAKEIRGKIVLCRHGAPPGHRSVHRVEKMTLSQRHGAAAMVLINGTPGNVPQAGTCQPGSIASIPGISVSREEGEWIARLAAIEEVKMRIRAVNRSGETTARNVVGEIPGEGDEVVIIGAHLDSWDLAQGAIDNGTGSVVVMEAARVLASLEEEPDRTIRFILFMGEEFGLYGSKAYVKEHADELDGIALMVNLDMVGRPTGLGLGGVDAALPIFRKIAAGMRELGVRSEVTNRAALHSDHQPFLLEGVPTASVRTKLEDDQLKYYHSAGDTIDKAIPKDLTDCAAVAALLVWEAANLPVRPAPRLAPDQVKEILIRDNLKEALELQGSWRWGD
ncbi:MAG: M28 family peptidase [Planctomycetota bacterium]|nr:M28 family peptidase [Planctomycetota bacterium]